MLVSILWLNGCDQTQTAEINIHEKKFQLIDTHGQPLEKKDQVGACVLDQFTGLMWQIKTQSPGLNDWRHTYSWHNPEESSGPELDYQGTANAGVCQLSDCDTWSYVNAVNETGLCGHNDWRLPSRDALASISDISKLQAPPTINLEFFPYAQAGEYWSSNDYQFQWDSAWAWNYQYGHDRVDWKSVPKYLRLVRGEALQLERVKD